MTAATTSSYAIYFGIGGFLHVNFKLPKLEIEINSKIKSTKSIRKNQFNVFSQVVLLRPPTR